MGKDMLCVILLGSWKDFYSSLPTQTNLISNLINDIGYNTQEKRARKKDSFPFPDYKGKPGKKIYSKTNDQL